MRSSTRLSVSVASCQLTSFFAIEKHIRNTTREIQAGCPSHTKAIYARRNELLAVELSDLFNGRQDITAFLDNCSHAITIKNNAGVQAFVNHRNSQLMSPAQREWIARNRVTVLRAEWSVHQTIVPSSTMRLDTMSLPLSNSGHSSETPAM